MERNAHYNKREGGRESSPEKGKYRHPNWPSAGTTAAALAKANVRILVEAELLNSNEFQSFYQNWMTERTEPNRKQLFVSNLDVKELNDLARYPEIKILRYTDCNDYKTFFQIVQKMGTWVYIISDEAKAGEILSVARETRIFLRVYTLDKEGKLQNIRIQNHREEGEVPGSRDYVDGFRIVSQIAPITRVPRRSMYAPADGDVVYTSENKPIRLSKEFISNPQSITYQTSSAGFQAKIYQPQWLTASYFEDKAKRMLEKPVKHEGICWPVDLLRNSAGEFVGVLMPAAEGYQLKQRLMSQQGLEDCFPNWNRKQLTHLAKVILEKIEVLHQHNVIFGLVNSASIFVKDEDHVYFTEMDTYQIEGYPIMAQERVLLAPELQNAPDGVRLYTKQQDYFGIAVLVFMILMPGKFPYNKGKNKDVAESVKNMSFAFRYGNKGEEHGTREYFGSWRFVWSHLGNDLKHAFYNTFQREQLYSLPEKRKSARYWYQRISELERELENPYDQESLRIFPRTFKRHSGTRTIRCVKCGIEHPDFYYRFPEKRICNSCLGKPSTTSFVCKSCRKTFYYDFATLFKYQELVEKKSFSMPTHCPYCRSDKRRCTRCGKLVPAYRVNDNGICIDCRNKEAARYNCRCGNEIVLTQGQYDFHMSKFGRLPQRCDRCKADKQRRY